MAQQSIQVPRVAGDDVGAGKSLAEQARQFGVSFDGDKPLFAQAMFEQGLGDGAGAGAEFEHVAVWIRGNQRAMAAASCRELGTTAPVRCGLASHSCRNKVVSVNVASNRLAMMSKRCPTPDSGYKLIHPGHCRQQKIPAILLAAFCDGSIF